MTDFSNSEMVLGFSARNWQDFQSASETLAAQVTATDAALAKVYSGTDPAGFISTLGRRAYRRPADGGRAGDVPGPLQQGLVADGDAEHVRQGRVAGHSRDAAVARLPVPDGARREGRAAQRLRDGGEAVAVAAGNGPDDKTLDLAAGPGKLDTADGAAALATTMLGEAAATSVMRQFHGEWLHFDRLRRHLQGQRSDLQGRR